MAEASSTEKPPGEATKMVNWYSGWRLWATAALSVLSAKLIGILGTVVAVGLFLWLQPKRGTGLALAASAIAGVIVAVVFSAALLPFFNSGSQPQQAAQPTQQQPSVPEGDEWWKKGSTLVR